MLQETELALVAGTSGLWWGVAGLALFVAAGLSFFAGYQAALWREKQAYERARSGLVALFETVLKTLDAARETCGMLERFPAGALAAEQTEQLEQRQTGLLESLTRLIQRHRPAGDGSKDPASETAVRGGAEEMRIQWLTTPVDGVTGLPDRPAFESNLLSLLELGRRTQGESGLLVVQIDKGRGLRARFGAANVEKLLRRLSHLVCTSVRDGDLVCRSGPDALAVLLPGLDAEGVEKAARAVRDTVRTARFRVDDQGPEVLVTASFGGTCCRPDENRELVFNRALDALARSERLGRNQLHVHNGERPVHCQAG